MELIHNPRCSKSRETLKLLEDEGLKIDVREYLKDELSYEELNKIVIKLNISPTQLLRKGEAIFKEKFKGKEFTDQEWIQIMVENPKLIERPILINGNTARVGRPPRDVFEIV